MNDQMIRVISSPSSSTTGFLTLIFGHRRAMLSIRRVGRCAAWRAPPATGTIGTRWQPGERTGLRQPRGRQPAAAAGRLQRLRGRHGAGRGGRGARAPSGPSERISAVGELRRQRARRRSSGALANENPPKLRTHDRYGNRVDEVEFHPAWHELLGAAVEHELHSLALEGPAARRPRRPRRRLHVHVAGRGRDRLPDLDDLLGDPGAAHPARAGRRVGAALPLLRLRPDATRRRRRRPAPWPGWG